MRVCVVTDTLADVNGVSRFVRDMARQARVLGADLRVITSARREVPRWENIVNLAPAWTIPVPRYPDLDAAFVSPRRVARILDDLKPDVVHVSTPGPVGWAGRRWAKRTSVPLAGVYHTDFPAYVSALVEARVLPAVTCAYLRSFYRPFALVLARSEASARTVRTQGIIAAEVLRTLPAGIDTDLFHPSRRRAGAWAGLGVPQGARVVLYVGRLSVEKNLPLLVRVWRQVSGLRTSSACSAVLALVGDGPFALRMRQALAGTPTIFVGVHSGEDLATLYASADLFVFPSATDTLGQVVLEAQASGLPALVSDRGGPAEIVRDGVSGMVLPADDADAWARAVARLLDDEGTRRALADRARETVAGRSLAAMFDQFWSAHAALAGRTG